MSSSSTASRRPRGPGARQLSELGDEGYRAVAPDQRGYSAGARPLHVADYGLDHLVADVLALADAMEMDTFDLVGHDWGGMVSWVAAARHPDRVRSLSVVSTPHPLALRARPPRRGSGPGRTVGAHGRLPAARCARAAAPRRGLFGFGSGEPCARRAVCARPTPGSISPCSRGRGR